MAQLKVRAEHLRNAKSTLDAQNKQLKTQVSDLERIESRLNEMWAGDANDAFHEVFVRDVQQFKTFSDLITKYGQVLEQAAQKYIDTEKKNVQLAKQR